MKRVKAKLNSVTMALRSERVADKQAERAKVFDRSLRPELLFYFGPVPCNDTNGNALLKETRVLCP